MKQPIIGILSNHALICALISWFVAQSLKIPLYRIVEKKWDFRRFFGSGGMPSSHTALVVSLMIMVGVLEGFDKPIFAVSVGLAAIVMVDAAGVRRETGQQAMAINQILRDVLVEGKPISDEQFKELVGHTPFEVFCGAILGVITSLIYLWLL